MLLKSGKTWTISNIPTGGATELTLVYKSNNTKSSVTCATEGTSISGSSKSYTITNTGNNQNITLVFGCSGNTRIDDVELSVKTAGSSSGAYTITLIQPNAGGTIAANKTSADENDLVTLTATPAIGYSFGAWTVLDDQQQQVEVTNNQFTMPASDVTVTGSFNLVNYIITVAETENGMVECTNETAHYGDEIIVEVTPSEGYSVASFTVSETNGQGNVYNITEESGIYSFNMPAYNITITVVFDVLYDGHGTFTKVTSLDDLEDGGYYVLYGVNGDYKGAMNSTCTSGKMGLTSVTVTNDAIIDPAVTIVWKLEAITVNNANYWMLYNEEAGKYCYISSDATTAFAMSDNPTNGYYSVSVDEGDFSFVGQYGSRMISIYQSDFRCYASSSAKTLYLYKLTPPSSIPNITVTPDAVIVQGAGETGSLAINYNNMTISGTDAFAFQYYDEEGQPVQQAPAWMNNVTVGTITNGYAVNYTIAQNDDADREARFKVYVMVDGERVESNLITITQPKYFTPVTYTLATSIVSGRHYIFVNPGAGVAMGKQNSNNRAAEPVAIENNVATVSSADVYEFVVESAGDGKYSIYDGKTSGYLYAASSSSNYLRTEEELDDNGKWTITFNVEDGYADIIAQGSNTRNVMQYNGNNGSLFACYASASQSPVYLYERAYVLNITGYDDSQYGYTLIASPIDGVNPEDVTGMTDGNFDLYRFNESADKEWENWKQEGDHNHFDLERGKGYLYAHKTDVTLAFAGTPVQGTTFDVTLSNSGTEYQGMNLVGNPFGQTAYIDRDFFVMNASGSGFIQSSGAIAPMQGIIVDAANGTTLTFTTEAPSNGGGSKVALNLSRNRGDVIDRAIVRFGEGSQLHKFQLRENSTKVYFTEDNQDFAVVRSQKAQGEMPVKFKAEENGTYTLSVNTEEMELNYLHLIDNMTGMDVDLLQTPSYTFDATTNDYASRFRLVFSANNVDGPSTGSGTFAFFSNGEWVIGNEGEATLQVIDVNGRIVSNETINGTVATSINTTPGVYMLRLVNGNEVKTQKIVVK